MPHLVATLIYLSQNYSYHIRGDRSPLGSYFYVLDILGLKKMVSMIDQANVKPVSGVIPS